MGAARGKRPPRPPPDTDLRLPLLRGKVMGGRNAGKELMDTVTAKQNGGRGRGARMEG